TDREDDRVVSLDPLAELRRPERTELGERPDQGRAAAVDLAAAGEMVRRGGQILGQERDELLAALLLEGRVEPALVSDRREPHGAHGSTAERARSVGREDEALVGQGEKPPMQAVVQLRSKVRGPAWE